MEHSKNHFPPKDGSLACLVCGLGVFRVDKSLGFRAGSTVNDGMPNITAAMEDRMEKNTTNQMESGLHRVFSGIRVSNNDGVLFLVYVARPRVRWGT